MIQVCCVGGGGGGLARNYKIYVTKLAKGLLQNECPPYQQLFFIKLN